MPRPQDATVSPPHGFAGGPDTRTRILVVDDDSEIRLTVRCALERDGYEFVEAENGREALDAYRRERPDIVLMDSLMPVMDGFEACERLRAISEESPPPILMITSLDDDDAIERALSAGARDFMPKPVHWAVLRQRVRRLLEEHDANRRMIRLTFHDPLTGLANRTLFTNRFGAAIARSRRQNSQIALMLLDLDNFKLINDSLGHERGDDLLRTQSERLISTLRESDTVGRDSGDEFSVLLEAFDKPTNIASIAQRVLDAVSSPVCLAGRDVVTSASIGIAVYPQDGVDIGTLAKHADAAMYRAKSSGGNACAFYTEEMEATAMRRFLLESELRRAVEREELILHYQPIVKAASGAVVAVEALVRWGHPHMGMVSPGDFIPVAEETGQILPIGRWVLNRACDQLRRWHDCGSWVTVSVNLSARQLSEAGFVDTVRSALARSGLEPRWLDLELTETTLARGDNHTAANVKDLHALGVGLSIDDFGTGYSSLSYLKQFPVKTLKVDRSFVASLPDDPADQAIVGASISLARGLGLDTVAEGVENDSQLRYLKGIGCDKLQGFYLSRPSLPEALDLKRFYDVDNAPVPHALVANA